MTLSADERAIVNQAAEIKRRTNRERRQRIKADRSPEKASRGRVRDRGHLAFIRRLPCACCQAAAPNDAAHLRMAAADRGKPHTGAGRKPDDHWTTPLCRTCHERQHSGSEARFWAEIGIDPITLCRDLYAVSGNDEAAVRIIREARKLESRGFAPSRT